jgi:Toprim-like
MAVRIASAPPSADVRALYAALGVELPAWAQREASVRCFAAPDAHARGDRDPSCSVNVETGAWRCWGCGAKGGAYDAALARGRTSREAMDLLIAHGLAERRIVAPARTAPAPARARAVAQRDDGSREPQRRELAMGEPELADARARLAALRWPPRVLRVEQARVWSRAMLLELGCGWERGCVVIPIRDARGELRGALRYAPSHDRAPKMLAAPGTRLGLVPHPAAVSSRWLVLVEGPPDMVSARSRGLPAIAVPGDDAWESGWAQLLVGRRVVVVMDCDTAGREAAARIAGDLKAAGVHGSVIDLSRSRDDGYDLTDWLHEHREWPPDRIRAALADRAPSAARVA